jgi:hypothetical protein
MTRRVYVSVLALAIAALVAGSPARAQDKKEGAPGGVPPSAKTKEHDVLRQFVGTWDCTIKAMWEPGKPPAVSKGTETSRLMGDGLWLLSDFTGDMMGMKFQGHGITGYDPAKKKYTGVWVDSIEAKLGVMEGTYDAQAKTLTQYMDGMDMTGKPTKYKMATVFKDNDFHVFTMSTPGTDGKDQPMMTIEYRRKK